MSDVQRMAAEAERQRQESIKRQQEAARQAQQIREQQLKALPIKPTNVREAELEAKVAKQAAASPEKQKVIGPTGAERTTQPDTLTKQRETLIQKQNIAKIYEAKLPVQLAEQTQLKQQISNSLSSAQAEHNSIVANYKKYDQKSYKTYLDNYNKFVKDSKENLKIADQNITRVKKGQAAVSLALPEIGAALTRLKTKGEPVRVKGGEMAEGAAAHAKGKELTESQRKYKEYIDQTAGINYLLKKGAATKADGKITLKTPMENLPDDLFKAAEKAGFKSEAQGKGLSFNLLEWGQRTTKAGTFERAQTEYYADVIGSGEDVIKGAVGWVSNALTGKSPNWRTVSPETVEYVRDLSPTQKWYLAYGAVGGKALGSYVVMAPVGLVTTQVFRAAGTIAKVSGITSPAAIKAIATEIASHPNLTRAVVYGGLTGVEANRLYMDYKAGKVKNLQYEAALRAGALLGGVAGFEAGVKVDAQLREWWATRGRTPIPIEALMTPETIKTGDFPTYKAASRQDWSAEYKALAKKLSGEAYLGEVAPEEYRVWHATANTWKIRLNEATEAATGTSLNKFPGLFMAPEPSPYFFKVGGGTGAVGRPTKLGLPGSGGVPELLSIDAFVEVMPSGMTRAATQKWLTAQMGTRAAYIPPVAMITPEMEAIIPAGSKLVNVGTDYYINWAGHRVLVNKYVLLPEGVALSSLPAGAEVVSLEKLISESGSITDTYLSFGLTPTSAQYSSTELSESDIKALAEEYGLSESEVRAIVSSTAASLSEITSMTLQEATSPTLSTSELKDLLETPSPETRGVPEPTLPSITEPTPPTEEPPSGKEPPSITEPEKRRGTIWLKSLELKSIKNRLGYFGKKERWKVKIDYPHTSETLTFPAQGMVDAIARAQRTRRSTKYPPDAMTVEKIEEKAVGKVS